jgi:hypothetical protein
MRASDIETFGAAIRRNNCEAVLRQSIAAARQRLCAAVYSLREAGLLVMRPVQRRLHQ